MESDTIHLTLPIKISYEVMRQLMDSKLIGKEIGTSKRKQGRITGTSLKGSFLPEYDVVLGLKMRIIRKTLVTKEVELFIHVSLTYEPDTGILSVSTFKIDAKSKNFLLAKALEILANRIYYRKVLAKASFNLIELISPQIGRLNDRIEPGMPISEGMMLYGNMEDITITKIEPRSDHVLIYALFKGALGLDIQKIPDTDFES